MQEHEEKFMKKAAQAGIAEVELGKLAPERAREDEVRQFGERMVRDHTHSSEELKRLAADKHVDLPREPDQKHRDEKKELSRMSGPTFDTQFMKGMLHDHRHVVEEFRDELDKAEDADLKKFIANTLPILEDHLRSARRIAQELGIAAEERTAARDREQRP